MLVQAIGSKISAAVSKLRHLLSERVRVLRHVQGGCMLEASLAGAGIILRMFLESEALYQTVKNMLVVSAPKSLTLGACSILAFQHRD